MVTVESIFLFFMLAHSDTDFFSYNSLTVCTGGNSYNNAENQKKKSILKL